jgi:hypothetical protein
MLFSLKAFRRERDPFRFARRKRVRNSEALARVGVANRGHEKRGGQGDHQDVHHRSLLLDAGGTATAQDCSPIRLTAEVPLRA